MRHEARRLVEDEQVLVLEQDLQWDRLADDLKRSRLRYVPLDRIARLDFERGFGRSPVDCDDALLDQALGGGAGEAGGVGAEENVEAFGGLTRGDGHAARHRLTSPSPGDPLILRLNGTCSAAREMG